MKWLSCILIVVNKLDNLGKEQTQLGERRWKKVPVKQRTSLMSCVSFSINNLNVHHVWFPLSRSGSTFFPPPREHCGTAPPGAEQTKCSGQESTARTHRATEGKYFIQVFFRRLPDPSFRLQPWTCRFAPLSWCSLFWISRTACEKLLFPFYLQNEKETQRFLCCYLRSRSPRRPAAMTDGL